MKGLESFPRLLDRTDKGILQPKQSYSWPSLNSREGQGSQSLKSSYCFMASGVPLQRQRDGDA